MASSNLKRVHRALKAMEGYDDEIRSDLVDLLTDLRHLAEAEDIDFDEAAATSLMHYMAETSDGDTE